MNFRVAIVVLIFSCSTLVIFPEIFDSLSEVQKYSKSIKEHPSIDNKNWQKPDYTSHFQATTSSFVERCFKKFLSFFKIREKSWDAKKFINLLSEVTNERKKQEKSGDFILKIPYKKKINCVIWSDLRGSFHSLVRALRKLKDMWVLDDNLKILNPNSFFIFNGNIVGRSAHTLETLTLILSLMKKNPKNVFFMKGDHEKEDNWKDFGLKRELQVKLKHLSKKVIPIENEIGSFFNTLPLAAYIPFWQEDKKGFVRISYFDRSYPLLKENLFYDFLSRHSKDTEFFLLKNRKPSPKEPKIDAIIKGVPRILNYNKTDGLEVLLSDLGIPVWSVFSCQSTACQKLYNFKNDAFAIMTLSQDMGSGTIDLYKQDSHKKDGFNAVSYDLFTQQTKEKKVKKEKVEDKVKIADKDKIVIGTTLDLSAELSEIGRYMLKGLRLKIDQQNRAGGINGKKITLIHLDDKYNIYKAKKNVLTLMKLGVDTLLMPMGSMTLKGYLPLVKEEKLLVMFPEATSSVFRKPGLKNIVHFLATSEKEGEVLARYLVNDLAISKIAFFYQPEPFSLGALKGAKKVLDEFNLKEKVDWIKTYHLPNSTDVSIAAKKIKKFNPQAIVLVSPSLAVQNLVNKLGIHFLFDKIISGISACSGVAFKTFLRSKNLNFINTQLVPDPTISNLDFVKNFRKEAELQGEALSTFTLEGYLAASLFVKILKMVKGKITKDKIKKAFESIKDSDFFGLKLNFNPQTRELLNFVWIDTGEEGMLLRE